MGHGAGPGARGIYVHGADHEGHHHSGEARNREDGGDQSNHIHFYILRVINIKFHDRLSACGLNC